MSYKNAKTILPDFLIEQIQDYISGELIYIPSKPDERISWGEKNGTRYKYSERNAEIKELYRSGATVLELSQRYFLSDDSIKKIVRD